LEKILTSRQELTGLKGSMKIKDMQEQLFGEDAWHRASRVKYADMCKTWVWQRVNSERFFLALDGYTRH
jgi:hypothetical protein